MGRRSPRPRRSRRRDPAPARTIRTTPLPVRLLSLDVSSTCVGWALFDEGHLINYGKYRPAGVEHAERLGTFAMWLRHLLEEHRPVQLVAEAPFFAGRGPKTYALLSTYHGVVQVAYYDFFGTPMPGENGVQPRQVKRILRVKVGDEYQDRKRLMVQLINKLYGLDLRYKEQDKTKRVSDDDIADAIAVGRAWLMRGSPKDATDDVPSV